MAEKCGSILVVDDNLVNRMLLASNLQQQGHSVSLAVDGRQAIEIVESQAVDLMLLDIVMPEMDGYQVLEWLKADERRRDIPVVIISAIEEMDSVVRCIEMGAEDYLTKPFDPVLLRARITAGLEKKRMRDQEVEYLRNVAHLTDAAAAVETQSFALDDLADVAARSDALGNLARVFQRMAREVYAREERLKQEVHELRIELDQAKRERQVSEITESEYFQQLRARVHEIRNPSGRDQRQST